MLTKKESIKTKSTLRLPKFDFGVTRDEMEILMNSLFKIDPEEVRKQELRHYHITLVSPQLSLPPVIVKDRYVAMSEFGKMAKLVEDQTGLIAMPWGKHKDCYAFLDGSYVKWRICFDTCLLDSQKKQGL